MKATHKILFSGPVGAGKTTAITSISDIPMVSTEEFASDETKKIKETTTVALDYGAIILPDGTRIHLYGTPGQERFSFMWEILSNGGTGLLLLIDGSDSKAMDNLKLFLSSFKNFINKTGVVVGITKQDVNKKHELEEYQKVLHEEFSDVLIHEIDARSKKDISLMVEKLLSTLAQT